MKQLNDDIHYVRPRVQPSVEPPLQVRERYKEQFDKAIEVVKEHLNQVSSIDEMTRYLNDQGYKTRTGKSWTSSICAMKPKSSTYGFPVKRMRKLRPMKP